MNQNFYGKRNRKLSSLLTLLFLFLLAVFIPPVVAEIYAPASIVQTQSDPSQLVREARELYQEQKYQSALPLWETAAKGYAQAGDRINQAIALSNLSLTHQQLGQWTAARSAIATSLKLLASEPNDSLVFAQTLDIRGKLQRETGKSAEAIESWQQAANIYQKLNNNSALTQNNLNQARALQDLGLYPRACKKILNTLSIDNLATCPQLSQLTTEELTTELKSVTAKPTLNKVSALRNLGNLLLIIGRPQQSEVVLKTSINVAEKLNSSEELSLTHLRLGNTYQALARGEEVRSQRVSYERQALSAYDRAIALAASPIDKLKARLNKLDFSIQQEQWQQAESLWTSLYPEIAANSASDREQIYASINYVQNIIRVLTPENEALQVPTSAELTQILNRATQQARKLGDSRIEAYAWGTLGRLEEITGVYGAAKTHTQTALNLVSSYDAADITYQYFWQLGRIEKEQDNITEAIAAYTKSYNALQSLRRDIATINPEVQFDFRDEVEPVYRELVELDLTDAALSEANNDTQTSQARLVQARQVIESLQLAQLNNFFQEACIEGQPQLLDQITDSDSDSAIIYPIVLEDRFEIILKLPNQPLRRYSNSFDDSKRVERILSRLNLTLTQSNSREILPLAQQVYDWIIQPLASDLEVAEIKTLVFVLDNPLQNIPMAVLHDGERYLVEKYALALTPGLQLLDPKPLTNFQLEAITGGISEIRSDFTPHQNFGDLPKVPEELQTIRQVGLAKSSLLNSEFTKQALKQSIVASGSPIVHLATHANFSSKAEDTFILSWDGQINIQDLDDLLRDDTFNRQNDIELLVLSACETASGDPRATLGLAGVAVQAGARSTLATLWSVVDESTAQMMGEFYRQLQKSQTTKANKAEVLRQAQLTLIEDEKFNHPHFWAPFILIGNWQ